MAEIILVQFPGLGTDDSLSPPCYKVQLALRAKGLDFKVRNITSAGGPKKYNPRGRLPVLLYDGESHIDSTDIITALDAKAPETSLTPEDPRDRALAKIYEDWADEVIYFFIVFLRWRVPANFIRLKEKFFKANIPGFLVPAVGLYAGSMVKKRLNNQGFGLKGEAVLRTELKECLKSLDALLQGRDYLVGDKISRADIAVFACIDQLDRPELTPAVAEQVNSFEAISAWREKLAPIARTRKS